MASVLNIAYVHRPSVVKYGSAPSSQLASFGAVVGKIKLPSDSIGSHVLTLNNVVAGSRVHVEEQAGTVILYDSIAGGSGFVSVTVTLPVYAGGSSKNDLRIRVRKGSGSPYYQPYETLTTIAVGASSIYVSQTPDE